MVSYPGGKGSSGIGSKTRAFVRSFFLPNGATEHPPGAGSPIYAGRMDGHPALFVHGGHNLIAVESRNHGENPFSQDDTAGDWPAWLVARPTSTHRTAIFFRAMVIEELEKIGYTNTHGGWTIRNGRADVECDVWMRLGSGK